MFIHHNDVGPGVMQWLLFASALLFASISMRTHAGSAGLAVVADDANVAGTQPRSVYEYHSSPGRGYLNLFLPFDPPLPRTEVERWPEILHASEAQRRFIKLEYERIVGAINARQDELIPSHLDGSAELYQIREIFGTHTVEFFDAMKSHLQDHNRVVRELRKVEQAFIESIRPILTREQEPGLHVIHARAERYWHRLDHLPTRGIDIDLYAVWLSIDHTDVDQNTRAKVADLLAAHEAQLTALYQQVEKLRQEHLVAFRRDRLRAMDNEISPAQFNSAYLRRRDRRMALGQRIRRLIDTTAQQVTTVLPDSAAGEWASEIQTSLFPELYPNPVDLDPLLSELESDPHFQQRVRAAIESLRSQYSFASVQLHARLVDFIIDWGDRGTRGDNGFQRQFLPSALEPKLADRTDLSRRYLHHLHDLVGSESLARHADAIPSALKSEFAELLEMADETGN